MLASEANFAILMENDMSLHRIKATFTSFSHENEEGSAHIGLILLSC